MPRKKRYISHEEAIQMMMDKMGCDREEAETQLELLRNERPQSVIYRDYDPDRLN